MKSFQVKHFSSCAVSCGMVCAPGASALPQQPIRNDWLPLIGDTVTPMTSSGPPVITPLLPHVTCVPSLPFCLCRSSVDNLSAHLKIISVSRVPCQSLKSSSSWANCMTMQFQFNLIRLADSIMERITGSFKNTRFTDVSRHWDTCWLSWVTAILYATLC